MGTLLNRRRYMGGVAALPYDENSYIQDGLVFQLDGINKGTADGTWTDLKGGLVFTNYGAVEDANGFTFANNAYMRIESSFSPNENYTIESSFYCTTKGVVISSGGDQKYNLFMYLSDGLFLQHTNKYNYDITMNSNSIVSVNDSLGYINGRIAQRLSQSDYWGSEGTNIGCSYYGTSRRWFSGKIYAIRVYNRKLTSEELLYNQKVDNVRFNLGLTI